MKRVLKILSLLVFVVPMIAATTMYLATEKKYAFTAENLAATIPEFVEDENKQIEMAKKWVELADPDTGMLSIADMFSACRAGGFNTYREVGFTQCRAFIVKLLENAEGELDEDFLNGYCPGLDEKGKNPNALSTITDKTRIGGLCSSKNIYAGEVTFRKGYNCTCTAYACNNGYELKKGQCVTLVADGQGNCLRKEFPKTDKVNTMAKAVEFCQDYATKNKCKYTNAIIYHSKSQIVCNAEIGEVDNVKAGMLENKDRKIAALQYYEVCGQHRGKTGKTEHCVDSLFKDVDVGLNEAAGLAQLYAKKNHGKTIYCDTKYRSVSNDDYIKCATLDKDVYYEFKFDDVIETNDATKFKNTVRGISLIYGGNWNGYNISGNCTQSLKNAAKKFGMKTNERYGVCVFEYGKKIESKNMANGLRTIDGIDNYIAKQIQVRGSVELRNQLKSYVQSQGFLVTGFDCDNSYGRVKNSWLTGDEDILTCRFSGSKNGVRYTNQPIDFVFDDVSEGKKNTREAGAQGMQCIVGNGKFDGHYCRGLTRDECFQLEREMRKQGIKSWDGSVDLVDWDESAGACELNSAQFANNMNKTGKYVAIAGLTIGGAVTGGASTTLAISLMAVELAGMAGEIYTDRKQELLPQQWANEFLAASIVCKNSSCAETTLRKNFAKISQASDMLNRDVLSAVDTELARLAEMIPQERVEQIMNSGEKPSCWDTWECQRWIFTGMQFASLGVGIGKGLVKLTKVFARKAATAATKSGTKVAALTAAHTDDIATVLSHTDDVSRIALHADDVPRLTSHIDDVKLLGSGSDDAVKLLGTGSDDAVKLLGTGSDDAARLASAADNSYDAAASFSRQFANDFAEIGIKEERTAAGGFHYRDVKTGQFVSRQTILERIYGKPQVAETVANGVDDMWRAGYTAGNKGADAARSAAEETKLLGSGAGKTMGATSHIDDVVYNVENFANPSAIDDAFKNTSGLVQINRQNMSADVLRNVMKKAQQYGFSCTDCGGDVLKFSKSVL